MHKISLKKWVVLLTVVPTTIIGLFIAGYFSYSRYIEINDFLALRSQSIIEPLAISSIDPLINKDREKLRHLIGFTHRSQSSIVKCITVFTADNQVFVSTAYHNELNMMRLNAGESIPTSTTQTDIDDYIIFRSPIIDESSHINEQGVLTPHQKIVGYVSLQVDKNKIKFKQQSQFLIAFSIVIFGCLISGLFAFKLINNVTRPIVNMVSTINRVREGKLESRVTGTLIGDLNLLKNGVNAMAQSLSDSQDEMQRSIDQATIDLRESLEQFEIQNVELDIAKRKAQDANKVKSEFLANMSHELRTPLNGVIGFTRQVLKTPLSDIQRDYLQTIERSAANLLSIINDILDFSKLDAGKMVIEKIPFSIRETVEETLALLAPSAHQKNIELSLRIAPTLPDSLIGDAMRIKQIIINLASNAIKFTDKGSVSINISCEHIEKHLTVLKVSISDTGIGMSQEQQSTIFEAFGQADKSVTRLYGGTGLGLVISQRLATEMKGEIGFISEDNKGSTFWFTFQCEVNPIPMMAFNNTANLSGKSVLYFEEHSHCRDATTEIMTSWSMNVTPVKTLAHFTEVLMQKELFDYAIIAHDVSPAAFDELKKLIVTVKPHAKEIHLTINSNSPNLQEVLLSSGAKSCISKPITPKRLAKALVPQHIDEQKIEEESPVNKIDIKVLAVDDNDANLKLIKALLLEQVVEITTAVNGLEAVNLCKNEKFALIFMDIQMPVMDGVTALKTIKDSTFNDNTPIVAVTAHAMTNERDKLLELGFDSYMTKPLDEAMLRHTIYEYCDLNSVSNKARLLKVAPPEKLIKIPVKNQVIDWPLALKRAGNKTALAIDMMKGLNDSLPQMKLSITDALATQDIEQLKTLIHKLNGACCYSGVPHLGSVTHEIETQLKSSVSIEDLTPEFYEFFEQIDKVMGAAPAMLEKVSKGQA